MSDYLSRLDYESILLAFQQLVPDPQADVSPVAPAAIEATSQVIPTNLELQSIGMDRSVARTGGGPITLDCQPRIAEPRSPF